MSTTYRTADRRFAAFALASLLTLFIFAGVDRIATSEPPAALSALMAYGSAAKA